MKTVAEERVRRTRLLSFILLHFLLRRFAFPLKHSANAAPQLPEAQTSYTRTVASAFAPCFCFMKGGCVGGGEVRGCVNGHEGVEM